MRYLRLTATLAAATLTLAACGGGSDATTTSGSDTTADAKGTMAETTATGSMADSTAADAMADTTGAGSMAETTAGPEALGTIVDVASSNPDFSTLVAAIDAAGLADVLNSDGPFTVFAPTNEAFTQALTDLGMTADELLANKDLLTQILTYHVVAGEVPAATVVTLNGQQVPTANGAPVTITVEGDVVMVNDATVVAADIPASNGVIHVIDKVLVPPTDGSAGQDATASTMADSGEGDSGDSGEGDSGDSGEGDSAGGTVTDNLMEVAAANPDFSILVQATGAADLFVTLANDGPYTVFAPTNEAFEQALSDLGMTADELFADKALLTKILSYHVVSGEYLAADVVELAGTDVETVEGSPIQITIDGDKVMVNDANVTTTDVMASNGVIHVIDKVLLPPTN